MIIEGVVNNFSNISFSDGDDVSLLCGKTAELMTSVVHEGIYNTTYRGLTFHGYSTTPLAIPITSTISPKFILWNPYGSGVNCVLVGYYIGYASGTNVEGNVQLGVITNIGSEVATGAKISAFTNGPILNGLLGGSTINKARFGIAATLTAASTQFLPLGISLMQLAAVNSVPISVAYNFNGSVIVPPGTCVFSCASAASVATYNERIVWYEFPT